MKNDYIKVEFQGEVYYMFNLQDSAIFTLEQYNSFSDSFAHLFPDGKIRRYNHIIGSIDDLKILENPRTIKAETVKQLKP